MLKISKNFLYDNHYTCQGCNFPSLFSKTLTVQSIMGPFTKYAMLDHFKHFIFITRYAGMGRGGGGGGGATIIY